jgi:glycosyltransferase involved in cell wall biosynthesis
MNSLSIVIPAYNEAANIVGVLQDVSGTALKWNMDYEIILVNDGSQDQTGILARELGSYIPNFRLVEHYPNRGYGGALKAGFAAAVKEWIAFIPGDGQFDFSEIQRLIDRTSEADIICGYRANRQDPFLRKVNAFGWNTLIRLLFGRLSRDIDCGFKLIRTEVLAHVNLESDGAMVDTELLAGSKVRGYRITEVPVTHLPRTAGESTGADLKVIFKAFRDLLAFRLRLNREIVQAKTGSRISSSSALR